MPSALVICHAAQLEQVADDVRGHVFADCGHYVPEEAPDELVRVLEDFLR